MSRIPPWFDGASTHEALFWKPQQKWSAQEHAGHLLDVEPVLAQRVTNFLSNATELTAADLSNRKTDEANHNAHPVQAILSDFRVARLQLMEQVEAIEPAAFSRALLHPRLKIQLRLVDHLYFMAEHDDHHLAHIWDLIHPEPHGGNYGDFR